VTAQDPKNGIPRCSRDRPVLASFAQQRLWLIDQMQPGTTARNRPIPTWLRGPLNVDALLASLGDIVRRHEVLRTTFRSDNGQPVQVVHDRMPLTFPLTDLSDLPRDQQEARVQEAIADEGRQPFDLSRGPVIRARLLRLAPDEHLLLYDVHGIAFDDWSAGTLRKELAAGYNARVRGTVADLPALAIQYADYAAWQRERISGPFLDKQLGYWRRQLDGLQPLDLPTDHARPSTRSYRGERRQAELPGALISELRALGRAEGTSLFMTMLAALQVMLARYADTDDVAVGVAARERRPEVQDLIGPFLNTVGLRGDLSGEPTFRDLLQQTAATAREAFAHAELPFDLLVRELRPAWDAAGTPLFPVLFCVQDGAEPMPEFDRLSAKTILPSCPTAEFDLALTVRLGAAAEQDAEADCAGAHCAVVEALFRADLFDADTIDRMLGHYRTLLEAVARLPDRPVTTLPMLTDREWQDIVDWNDTRRRFPADACLHELVESHTEHDDAPAVVCGQRVLSRAELEASANRLAHRLRELGVRPETIVGVCLRRSPELVVAILGVLKAGGAYLPLDPDYPAERLRVMLDDAGCVAVVTDEAVRSVLGDAAATLLCLDSAELDEYPARRLEPSAGPENLAYVIYTSGSTGDPKGIALQHRGAVNNFTDFNDRFGIGPGDSVLSVSPPSFDMSVYDIVGMLAAGGTVVLPEAEVAHDPPAWARLLRDHEVTVWHSAPALLELLLDYVECASHAAPRHLRLALVGGDWIPVGLPDRLWDVAPGARFISLGGPTEASMDSTIFPVKRVDPGWTSIPYGRPMANQRVYVLDRHRQPVPVRVPGELYLAGTGLARGYLNRPELTAERFVWHTFHDGRTERLYQTGDVARYRRDGVLELLGRRDFQVKIHGMRIELGEIEAVLRRHEAVANAVVVAPGARGRTRLAAYVTRSGEGEVSDAELRQWLGELLPAHMVPGTITTLGRLPTTPNGKVDRRALAAQGAERRHRAVSAPAGSDE
jgi:amino acid adenylation domain-containing protein